MNIEWWIKADWLRNKGLNLIKALIILKKYRIM